MAQIRKAQRSRSPLLLKNIEKKFQLVLIKNMLLNIKAAKKISLQLLYLMFRLNVA